MKYYYLGERLREADIRSGGDRYVFEVVDYLENNVNLKVLDTANCQWKAEFKVSVKSFLISIRANLWAMRQLKNVKKNEIILINAYFKQYFFLFVWIARYVKQVNIVVGVNAFYFTSRKNALLNFVDKIIMWMMLKPASFIVANAVGAKASIMKIGINEKRIEVVHPRIHLPEEGQSSLDFKSGSKLELLYVGHMSPYQKTHVLIQALEKIPDFDVHLHIVGEPKKDLEYYGKIKKMIEEYGLQKRITFHGILKGADLSSMYKQSDVLISTMDTEGGIGRVVIEGMYFGVVPIVVDRIASREFINDRMDGFLYPSCDVNALIDLIKILYENRNILDNASRKAQKSCKKANFDRSLGQQFLELMNQRL